MKKKKYIIISILTLIVLVGVTSVIMVSKKNDKTKTVYKSEAQLKKEKEFMQYKRELAKELEKNRKIEKQKNKQIEEEMKKVPEKIKKVEENLAKLNTINDLNERKKIQEDIFKTIETDEYLHSQVKNIINTVEKTVKTENDLPFLYKMKHFTLTYGEMEEIKMNVDKAIEEGEYKDENIVLEIKKVLDMYYGG